METRKIMINSKKYYFNFSKFNEAFVRMVKKDKITIGELEIKLAEHVNRSSNAIHNWRFSKNGPSDLETIKSISKFFNIRNYKILLHGKENHAMNNLSDLQILAIKRIYDSVLDYLGEFLKSNGFNDYWFDLEEEPKYREGIICDMAIEKVEKVILVLKKEYIFLKESELYSNLENFIYNDLYDIFDGKISYGYRFEAPVYGNLTTYEEYCKTLDKFNDIICRYI